MLVNYKHKFIFVRPRYVGSSSVEFSLSQFCKSNKDIITPISFPEEINRRSLKIYPKNYGLKYYERIYNLSVMLKDRRISDFFLVKGKNSFLKSHSKVQDLINYKKINISEFEVISISRHPYDKALTAAKWNLVKNMYLKKGIKIIPNADEIMQSLNKMYEKKKLGINMWPNYTHQGNYIVNTMIEYNNLNNIDKILNKKFNFGPFTIPKLKKFNTKEKVTTSMISDEIKKYIQKICSNEFEKFSYEK